MAKQRASEVDGTSEDFQLLSTGGFPPIWQPETEGQMIDFYPVAIRLIESKKGKKGKKGEAQTNAPLLDIELVDRHGSVFVSGTGNNQSEVELPDGERGCVSLSSGLVNANGESGDSFKLAVIDKDGEYQLSKFASASMKNRIPIRLLFKGKIKLGKGRTFKRFDILGSVKLRDLTREM